MLSTKDNLLLTLSDIRQLTPRIRSYTLRTRQGEELPLVTAGAHLGVPVIINGHTEFRNYSIFSNSIYSNATEREHYQIAVLNDHTPASHQELRKNNYHSGAAFIHDHFVVGMEIECKPPINNFP